MRQIPLRPVANQAVTVNLSGIAYRIELRQFDSSLFLSVSVGNRYVISMALCLCNVMLVPAAYMGLLGNLQFVDTQPRKGQYPEDPWYEGLGERWRLLYIEPSEVNQ